MDDGVFASYNCFGCCAGTLLRRRFDWGLDLALHWRCQFFFCAREAWDDDNRFVGEFPRPWDQETFAALRDVLGVSVIRHLDGAPPALDGVERDIAAWGAAVLVVDKYYLERACAVGRPKHVLTTAIITGIDRELGQAAFLDAFGDDNTPVRGRIGLDDLAAARLEAPHGRGARGCRLTFAPARPGDGGATGRERPAMARRAARYVARGAATFVRGAGEGRTTLGSPAVARLAAAVTDWADAAGGADAPLWRRLVDCSRHLGFVQRQRAAFARALSELGDAAPPPAARDAVAGWRREAQSLAQQWERVRMMMFLASARRQAGAVGPIARDIAAVGRRETGLLADIAGRLEGVGEA